MSRVFGQILVQRDTDSGYTAIPRNMTCIAEKLASKNYATHMVFLPFYFFLSFFLSAPPCAFPKKFLLDEDAGGQVGLRNSNP